MYTKGTCPSACEVGWQRVSKLLKFIQRVYSGNEPHFQLLTRVIYFILLLLSSITHPNTKKQQQLLEGRIDKSSRLLLFVFLCSVIFFSP